MKPYPKYKDSGIVWLGKIPEHWDIKPGLSIFTEKKIKNIGLVEKQVLSLSYGKIIIKPVEKLRGLVPESFETYQIVESGDIIIRSTDMQNDHTSLRTGLVKDKGIITSAYICLSSNNAEYSDYNHWLLHGLDLMKVFYGLGSGLRQNLSWNDFKRLLLPVISPEEKTQIARYLDWQTSKINKFIKNKKKLIALLKEQKQNIINEAVTKGINPNVKMKNSGIEWIGEIPEHWEVRRLKNISKVILGKMLKTTPSDGDELKPYLRSVNVQWMKINQNDISSMWFSQNELKQYRLKNNDLVVCEGGEVGRASLWCEELEECYIQNAVHKITAYSCIMSKFLLYQFVMLGSKSAFNSIVNRVSIAHLTREKLVVVLFAVPPKEEQLSIVEFIEKETALIDKTIARTEKEIELIQEYRTRLVSDVVTGKIDVRDVEIPDFVEETVEMEENEEDLNEEQNMENGDE